MKNKRRINSIIFAFAIIFLTNSCQDSSKDKLDEAKAESKIAEQNLESAKEEYRLDLEQFRTEAESRLAENQKSIKAFKVRIANSKIEAKADYEREINLLEKKNSDMQRKIDEFKMDSAEKWKSFKKEFNHDLEELGSALKDLSTNNVE